MLAQSNQRWSANMLSPEEQYEAKRRALIREAGKAFSKSGFHNTSLADVAAALNVTKTALYYYVKDKNEILLECHNLAIDLGEQALAEALAAPAGPLDQLLIYTHRYMQLLNSELGNYAVLNEPLTSLRPPEREKVQLRLRKHDTQLRRWIKAATEAGEINPGEPAVLVAFIMGAINYIPTWFDPNGKVSGDQVASTYVKLIRNALVAGGL